MKKRLRFLTVLLIVVMSQQAAAETNASASTFRQFLQKGVFAFLPDSCQKYRIPLLTIFACGAVVKLIKDWPEIKYSYYFIKRFLAVKERENKVAKLTRENAIYEVPFFERVQAVGEDGQIIKNIVAFYDNISNEVLVFQANDQGIIEEISLEEIILYDHFYFSFPKKVVKVKTTCLKLENIASAGCLGGYLKIGFAPNEIIGCFDGFENGKEMEL